jgi:hypothetical protein
MTPSLRNLGKIGAGLLTVCIVGLLPVSARAEAILFRNDTNGPIIVQAACVVRGVLRSGPPYLLKAGDSTPPIVMRGNKLITVYDGQNPNHVVHKDTIPAGPTDQAYDINLDGAGAVKFDARATPPGP